MKKRSEEYDAGAFDSEEQRLLFDVLLTLEEIRDRPDQKKDTGPRPKRRFDPSKGPVDPVEGQEWEWETEEFVVWVAGKWRTYLEIHGMADTSVLSYLGGVPGAGLSVIRSGTGLDEESAMGAIERLVRVGEVIRDGGVYRINNDDQAAVDTAVEDFEAALDGVRDGDTNPKSAPRGDAP